MNEKVYKQFAKEGLNIPFPQMDIHVQNGHTMNIVEEGLDKMIQ
jgi:small-conductance mechanosensitive channel